MNTYIALLRGINISGKNKVEMPFLKQAFEDMGFLSVRTYINSGNVIFSSLETDIDDLSKRCKRLIEERFAIDVPIVLVSQCEFEETLQHAPIWWDIPSDEEVTHQAIFLIPPITIEEVFQSIKEARPEYEKVAYYKNVIFWSAPRSTLSKTSWYKIACSSVNYKVTIRNARTTKKLLSLMNE